MNPITAVEVGKNAEDLAYNFLKKKGLKLLERNFRIKGGEIDLIMQDKTTIVFVEVRYRFHQSFGKSAETVHYFKQKKIIKAATTYLQQKNLLEKMACRFDVVGIQQTPEGSNQEGCNFEWIQHAFTT